MLFSLFFSIRELADLHLHSVRCSKDYKSTRFGCLDYSLFIIGFSLCTPFCLNLLLMNALHFIILFRSIFWLTFVFVLFCNLLFLGWKDYEMLMALFKYCRLTFYSEIIIRNSLKNEMSIILLSYHLLITCSFFH